jgi:hypothetical protein
MKRTAFLGTRPVRIGHHGLFPRRGDKATRALRDLEDSAQPELAKALANSASLEQKRRVQRLLEPWRPSGVESLRFVRALEVIEYLGSADAKQLLVDLAQGTPGVFRTEASTAALKRWNDASDKTASR